MNREEREKELLSLAHMLSKVEDKMGKEYLSDDDVMLLCYSKILHTYTFKEMDYKKL